MEKQHTTQHYIRIVALLCCTIIIIIIVVDKVIDVFVQSMSADCLSEASFFFILLLARYVRYIVEDARCDGCGQNLRSMFDLC